MRIETGDLKIHEAHESWKAQMEQGYALGELVVAKQRHGSSGKIVNLLCFRRARILDFSW